MKIKHSFIVLMVGLVLIALPIYSGIYVNQPYNPTDDIRSTLLDQGFNLVEARTESPAVKVDLNKTESLIEYANKLNITTIYDTNEGFLVLDAQNDVGYFYYVVPFPTWCGLHFAWFFVVLLLSFGVWTGIIMKYGD